MGWEKTLYSMTVSYTHLDVYKRQALQEALVVDRLGQALLALALVVATGVVVWLSLIHI